MHGANSLVRLVHSHCGQTQAVEPFKLLYSSISSCTCTGKKSTWAYMPSRSAREDSTFRRGCQHCLTEKQTMRFLLPRNSSKLTQRRQHGYLSLRLRRNRTRSCPTSLKSKEKHPSQHNNARIVCPISLYPDLLTSRIRWRNTMPSSRSPPSI